MESSSNIYSYSTENDPYNPTGSDKSTGDSSRSSYNPNAVVYTTSDEGEINEKVNNIYSIDHEDINFTTEEEQESSWSDLFINGLKNIEDDDLSKEISHWNELFQNILDLPESDLRSKKLSTIANDFVYCADTFGKIIISELHTPLEKKTIKPVDVGGVAGGLKFKIQDIMFKFVIDTEIREGVWMYGGTKRSDAFAQKSADHEIKGLNHFMEISNNGLIRFPLMAIIDYRGYRLLAISQLPIGKDTIVYGSCDSGKTVHNSDPIVYLEMERISKILNLRGHTVGFNQVFLYGPGDIEVHKGRDGRYYMIDFARIFPPEYPLIFQQKKEGIGREIFYQMLRPELVARSEVPLSSDAFSGWQTSLFEENLNRDVVRATNLLHSELIATVIHNMNRKPEVDYSPSRHKIFESYKILNLFHSQGINTRYIGYIASQCTNKSIKEIILSEIVSRVWKRLIRSKLRRIMDLTRRPSEEPYKVLISEAFGLILKNEKEQIEFWSSTNRGSFKHIALKVFPRCLSESDMISSYDLRDGIDLKFVILKLIKMLNIKMNPSSFSQFIESKGFSQYIIGLQDIEGVGSTVKYPCIIDYANASHLLYHAKELLRSPNPNPIEVDRWISNTGIAINEAVRQMPKSFKVISKLLEAYHIKVSVTDDPQTVTRIFIVSVLSHGLNFTVQDKNLPFISGLMGLVHLQLATIYLFHSDLVKEFREELLDSRKLLENALQLNPNCLDEYIRQTLPITFQPTPVVLDKYLIPSHEKRKVHNLLTLIYLLSHTTQSISSIHKPFQKYLDQIIQIDNFEILPHAEHLFDSDMIVKFFQVLEPNLQSLSIRKLTLTKEISNSISKLSKLKSLGISDISIPLASDESLNSFFTLIFNQCNELTSLTISSNKNINDETFKGLYEHFTKLKSLELNRLPMITDLTLLRISPFLNDLLELSLNHCKNFSDISISLILQSCRSLKSLYLDSLPLITEIICLEIIKHQKYLSTLTLINCDSIIHASTDKISKELLNLKLFHKNETKTPHTYKFSHLKGFDKASRDLLSSLGLEMLNNEN